MIIVQNMWDNTTKSEWLCCFWHSIVCPKQVHDFLCDGLLWIKATVQGFKGFGFCYASPSNVRLNRQYVGLQIFVHSMNAITI